MPWQRCHAKTLTFCNISVITEDIYLKLEILFTSKGAIHTVEGDKSKCIFFLIMPFFNLEFLFSIRHPQLSVGIHMPRSYFLFYLVVISYKHCRSHFSQSSDSVPGTYGGNGVVDPYSCFVDSDIVGENVGMWYIGVRQLLVPELNIFISCSYLPLAVPDRWKENKIFYQNYKIKSSVVTCVYMDDGSNIIRYDGVKVFVTL